MSNYNMSVRMHACTKFLHACVRGVHVCPCVHVCIMIDKF